ncbi:MAG: trimethylamine methyltransferase family protein [Treponema sp.]|jgi:trimethylamine--corrinoid protein Co-methyltransferase|nr:trimethylamine methyltransferase family protein [Treponema sp.]
MKLERFRVLSDADRAMVHKATIEVLSTVGIRVHSPRVLQLLEKAGAKVDGSAKTALLPEALVDKCLKSVPKTFSIFDRKGKREYTIGDRKPKFAAGHNAVFMVDPHDEKRVYAKVSDIDEYAVLVNMMENIDIVGVPLNPQDVPAKSTLLHAMKSLYEYTDKPLYFSTESSGINAAIVDMMKAASGGKSIREYPSAIGQLSPTSPLYWEEGASEAAVKLAEDFVPLVLLPEPQSGVSAPYSVAGLLTIHNTEVVSGIVIAQSASPGSPLVYGSSWTTFDMKRGKAIIGSPETNLLRIAGCEMADFYGIPSHTTAPNTDANAHDQQMAWEKALSSFCSAGVGNDIIMNSAMFATGLSVSHAQLLLDNEVNAYIARMCRGIDVNPESIDVKSIQRVGHGGLYMEEELTFKNLRTGEFHEYGLPNSNSYDEWMVGGAKSNVTLAAEKAAELLKGKREKRLGTQEIADIDDVIHRFEAAQKNG